MSLACVLLHNICIDLEGASSITLDLSLSSEHGNGRRNQVVRDFQAMTCSQRVKDSSNQATKIRECFMASSGIKRKEKE